ncbi:cytochrome c oxidase accessory protein CcoG [Futiania mangrovi]|uniref:Cytochrome c oxidase accessory protein CcoG n=1 Tax=Futiania mangrovi TaxID=2959716 RepID=A0A9J6PAE6_9PROT|nr:cytochrome c oxidase accessory protein CcoG [Futiania mangrovii]MCP1335377.1 cytochrome c oxidase accessory protein CcoG [Futiania mangrovii]
MAAEGLQDLADKAAAEAAGAKPADRGAAEAAPGVGRHEVEAVNKAEARPLYASRPSIHPKRATGIFRNVKWVVMAVTLGIYYLLPWVRWDRGPNAPDQAVLLDFPNRKFYFFFIEIWPQEVYYITGLLILAALALFLVTSIAGRVWCGYTCPQTVWTDLMIAIERFVEGDRNARIRLDKQRWNGEKILKRSLKHFLWLMVGVVTGGAFVFYFRDAPTLAMEFLTLDAPFIAWLFVGIFAATTYLLGGLAREQVCTYMCPWPRIQGAMFDEHSLLVSYRAWRGEPRGPHRKGEPWEGRGDCIDCKQCVVVCPAGIDIRDGAQLECIQCALCIDACNEIMDRIGRPRNLIAYDTHAGLATGKATRLSQVPYVRARTVVYAAAIAVVAVIMAFTLATRDTMSLNVLRERNPLFVTLSDGSIRNTYTLKIINKLHRPAEFRVSVSGVEGATIALGGHEGDTLTVPADDLLDARLFVAAPNPGREVSDLEVRLEEIGGERSATYETTFRGPER